MMSDEDYTSLQAQFPSAFVGKRQREAQTPLEEMVTDWGNLDQSHMDAAREHVASGESLGVAPAEIKSIRPTHHRCAQLLAAGMDETRVAALCNYSAMRVSQLKHSPAFAELVAYYRKQVDVEFADFVTSAAALSEDILHEIQRRMDENPESISPSMLNEFLKTLADRSGNAPVSKNLNLNVNMGMGEKLKAARERAQAAALSVSGPSQ